MLSVLLETKDSPVIEKTKELCALLTEQPSFHSIRQRIQAFMDDEDATQRYQRLCDLQEMLQSKDQQGVPLSDEEVEHFESEREKLFAIPVARGFMDAQQELHKLQETIGQYVSKTFKLGRVPESSDFESTGCGPNCGCSGGN
jgi:cell fate (sporulation/competence/biofilm development) regulator YlbF (YheA/YmcA/DUF963 family)